MKNIYFFAFLILALLGCNSAKPPIKTNVVYLNNHFYIPPQPTLAGTLGNNADLLIFRYSNEKGKKYVAFSNLKNDITIDLGCPLETFFEDLFEGETSNSCDNNQLSAFKKSFIEGHKIKTYTLGNRNAFYSAGESINFIFVFDKNGNAIKIESDFLVEADLPSLFEL